MGENENEKKFNFSKSRVDDVEIVIFGLFFASQIRFSERKDGCPRDQNPSSLQ